TAILAKFIDLTIGFITDARSETEGLDETEHGEVGFDLGPALEMSIGRLDKEPHAASVPPNGQHRFAVVVEGAPTPELLHTWSNLCQAGKKPPSPQFRAVYPYMTVVDGNRFHFRGGDSKAINESLRKLFQDNMEKAAIRTHVES